jgi:LysM repeat protein
MNLDFRCFFNKEDETMFAKRMLQITLILAVLAACLTIPRSASAAGPCGSTYIVQPGDWLSRIANRCGVTLSALYAANPGVVYQRYIYPGQVLNIPGGPWPGNPGPGPCAPQQYCCPTYCQPYGTTYPFTNKVPTTFYFPSMIVTPRVGSSYYGSTAYVGTKLTFQTKVQNNGDVPLQVVANLTPPSDWDVNDKYNDCPTTLATGSMCTLTWVFTPRVSGQAYVRVYVRGLYTDSSGYTQRITQSPAFFFNVGP